MVERRLLERKLAALAGRIARARAKLTMDRARFVAEPDVHEIVAFNLFLAFQEALDVAAHVIADAGWDVPATAREHFDVLARNGWLDAALAADLGACAGARNLIAHAYGNLDLARVYDEAPVALAALDRFVQRAAVDDAPPR